MDLGYKAIDPDVRREVVAAVETLKAAGARVEEVDLGWDERLDHAMMCHFALGMDLRMRQEFGDELERASSIIRFNMREAPTAGPVDALAEEALRYEMSQDLARVLANHDVLLTPTAASTRMPADFDPMEAGFAVDGRALADPILGWVLTVAFNMLSSSPVWSVPAGKADNGVPVGLQFVGRPYDDEVVTGIALAWDAIRPALGTPAL
jgi:Asp-tRNA(Asn)/Glu-tRNA(Gln) amidotransferase A subunit family amidase